MVIPAWIPFPCGFCFFSFLCCFHLSLWTHRLMCTSTGLGQCFHCQARFLGSSFTPPPPRAAYQSALVREGSLLRSSSEEVIQLFGVACLWEAQVTYQKAEAAFLVNPVLVPGRDGGAGSLVVWFEHMWWETLLGVNTLLTPS